MNVIATGWNHVAAPSIGKINDDTLEFVKSEGHMVGGFGWRLQVHSDAEEN